MNNTIIAFAKISILAFYFVAASASFFPPLAEYQTILSYVVLVLVIAHLGEFLVVQAKLTKLEGSKIKHFIQTLLFGLLYWQPLLKVKTSAKN